MKTARAFRAMMAALVAAALSAGCADQPPVKCTVADGALAAKFYLVSGTGACSMIKGDTFGVSAYVVNPTNPGDGRSKVAIQSQTLGNLRATGEAATPPVVDADPAHVAYALGVFQTVLPGPDGVCTVPALDAAEIKLGDVPMQTFDDGGTNGPQAATDVKYAWSNVRVYVTPAQIGVQLTGELTFTQDGCTASYHVAGLWPNVSCDDGTMKPDPTLCVPDNGINPDVQVACDPDLLLCVPAQRDPF
jgi:hypothetical protein